MDQRRWRVFVAFSRAIYLADAGDDVCVLVDHRAPRGPLHRRIRKLPELEVGDEVQIADNLLSFDRGELAIEEAWVGGWVRGLDKLGQRTSVLHQPAEIDRLAREIGGRGPGLTPEGDDVLAGVLLTQWHLDPAFEAELARVARAVETNRIASAFLIEAARGQSIEPAHDLLEAFALRDDAAIKQTTEELATYGASSGTALAQGIVLGLSCQQR